MGGGQTDLTPLSECDLSLRADSCTDYKPGTIQQLHFALFSKVGRRAKIPESREMCELAGEMNVQNNIPCKEKNVLLHQRQQRRHCCWRSSCALCL